MGYQAAEGKIVWLQDLNASTSSTAYPTLATQGRAKEELPTQPGSGVCANRLWVMVDYRDTAAATSCVIGLYGYAADGVFATGSTAAATWAFIGALNKGQPIAASGAGGFQVSALRVVSTEAFNIAPDNFTRFATRSLVPAGTSPTVSTFIGFCVV